MRNENAGHGQGSAIELISDEFAEYALNLATTNIVLLVGYIGGMIIILISSGMKGVIEKWIQQMKN